MNQNLHLFTLEYNGIIWENGENAKRRQRVKESKEFKFLVNEVLNIVLLSVNQVKDENFIDI